MAFTVQTVTTKGSEALASATVNNKLVIVGCDADTTVLTEAQALAVENRPASPVSNSTDVTQIGDSTSGHIDCRAYFQSGVTTGGNANTLYLYGYLQSAPSTYFVIFVASDPIGFHLPAVGDVASEWQILFDIVYTPQAGAVGFATQATYATKAELDNIAGIAALAVTTHSQSDPTVGDNQTILGNKTFSSVLTASAGLTTTTVTASGNATVGGTLGVTGSATLAGLSCTTVTASGNGSVGGTLGVTGATTLAGLTCNAITSQGHNPSTTSTSDSSGYSLGTSSYRWRNLYARNGYLGSLSISVTNSSSGGLSVAGDTTVGGTLTVSGNTASTMTVTGGSSFTGNISVTGDLTVSGDIEVISGNIEVTYGNIEADVGDSHYLKIKNGSDDILYVDVTGVHVSDKLYLEDASSISPSYSNSTLTVPIGGIVAIFAEDLPQPSGLAFGRNAGESVTVSASSVHVAVAKKDGTFAVGVSYITAGTYRLLCDVEFVIGSGYGPFALVQRIS